MAVAPFGGHYLMQLILGNHTKNLPVQYGLLDFMLERGTAYHRPLVFALVILSKVYCASLHLTSALCQKIFQRSDFLSISSLLFAEYSNNAEAIYLVLRQICTCSDFLGDPPEWAKHNLDPAHYAWSECLLLSNYALQACVRSTDFCRIAVDAWDLGFS
jgi:hypothetical protein